MIRRNVCLADGRKHWALISQVEHARISGELAARCVGRFGNSSQRDDLQQMRREVVDAIVHHDDGWRGWDELPALDDELGRPLTFTELPQSDSLAIWSESIAAAAAVGNLAGAMVAGHFLALLATSDSRDTQAATAWETEFTKHRKGWLKNWQASSVQHTLQLADEALAWLQAFDWASLWLAMLCPSSGEHQGDTPADEPIGGETAFASRWRAAPPADDTSSGRVHVDPWPFDANQISLTATARLAPQLQYNSPQELLAACQPTELTWRLLPADG